MAVGTEFTSTNFRIIDPVITVGVGRSTSNSFQAEQSVGQPAIGESTSASFILRGGFLYFPAPTPAPTPAPPALPPAAEAGGGPIRFPIILPFVEPFLPPEIPVVCPPGLPPTDLDCDGKIGIRDLSIFLFFGTSPAPNRADFNRDAAVDTKDLSILFTDWTERLLTFVPEAQFEIFAARPRAAERGLAIIGEALTPEEVAPAEKPEEPIGIFERIGGAIRTIVTRVTSFISSFFR